MQNRACGIMFHHFHGEHHPAVQGSISSEQFEQIIARVGRHNILDCDLWMEKALAGTLQSQETCFTFDDNLRCQFDVALPVLFRHNIRAFWFIHTAVISGERDKLEIYRHFRTTHFKSVKDFYKRFEKKIKIFPFLVPEDYLAQYSFYTAEDRRFRYIRDQILGADNYASIMDNLLKEFNYDENKMSQPLWMDSNCLTFLHKNGHHIGLHSSTHPTQMASLSPELQRGEYSRNADAIEKLLGVRPISMSHPCNSYNTDTLNILKSLGIQLGFRANPAEDAAFGTLEYPREDHSNLIRRFGL